MNQSHSCLFNFFVSCLSWFLVSSVSNGDVGAGAGAGADTGTDCKILAGAGAGAVTGTGYGMLRK